MKVPEEVEATEEEVIAEDEIATDEVVQETTEDEVVAEAPEYTEITIDEDVNALVEGEELSESSKKKQRLFLKQQSKVKLFKSRKFLKPSTKKTPEEVEEIKGA